MRVPRIRLEPAAALLYALLYFLDGEGLFAAAAPAVLLHELGHVLALRLCGARIRALRLAVSGLELDYSGALTNRETLLCALSGPAAGLLYALSACALGGVFLRRSGALSLCLTAFNLLPVLPLDGGRALASLAGPRAASVVGAAVSMLLCAAGVSALLAGGGPALLAAGV